MKKTILAFALFLFSNLLPAQVYQPVTDSIAIKKAHSYVNEILQMEKDSLVLNAFPLQYKLRYQSSCSLVESVRGAVLGVEYYAVGKSFTENHNFYSDTVGFEGREIALSNLNTNKQKELYLCADNISILEDGNPIHLGRDSLTVVEDFFIRNLIFSDPYGALRIDRGNTSRASGISFEKGKYLIVELYSIYSIGSQTSRGSAETLFLERID